uniref:Dirigent protein n=1 Tax=Strongyloides papillosus TaxID=174720 RepID=A0A0N5BKN1_STREA
MNYTFSDSLIGYGVAEVQSSIKVVGKILKNGSCGVSVVNFNERGHSASRPLGDQHNSYIGIYESLFLFPYTS